MKLKILIAAFALIPFISNAQNQQAKPILRVGSGSSRISTPEFRNLDTVSVTLSDFNYSDYAVKEFTVTVLSNDTKTYKSIKNTGSKINDEIKQLFSFLKSNDSIVIDGIAATDPAGKTIYLDDRFFRVR
jgi:hypothetical protein